MSLVIPPGFALASFVHSSDVGTPPLVTTLGVDISAFGGDHVEAANTAFTYWAQNIMATMDGSITLDRVTLAVGSDGPGGSVDSNLTPYEGDRSGAMVPASMSAIARKVTNDLGRRGRGRMFIPGVLTQTEVDEAGKIGSTRLNTLQTALNTLYGQFQNGSSPLLALPPVLLHSSAPTTPTPITGFPLATLVGWVRGRIR